MATRSGPLRSPQPKKRGQAGTSVGLPYIRGASKTPARIFKNHGVGAYHKPFNTLRSILVHPRDKTPDHKKCDVVYEIQCLECPAKYVGETARTLETRMKDHLKQKSLRTVVGEHEHPIKMDDVKVIACEDNMWRRKIPESIEIRTRHPAINRNQGYEPPLIYDKLLSCGMWSRRISLIRLDEVAVMVTQASNLATYLTLIRYLSNELSCLPSPITTSMLLRNIRQLFGLNIDDC